MRLLKDDAETICTCMCVFGYLWTRMRARKHFAQINSTKWIAHFHGVNMSTTCIRSVCDCALQQRFVIMLFCGWMIISSPSSDWNKSQKLVLVCNLKHVIVWASIIGVWLRNRAKGWEEQGKRKRDRDKEWEKGLEWKQEEEKERGRATDDAIQESLCFSQQCHRSYRIYDNSRKFLLLNILLVSFRAIKLTFTMPSEYTYMCSCIFHGSMNIMKMVFR